MIKILRKGLPVVGFAKIGATGPRRDNGKKPGIPFKLDHIELTSTQRDRDGNLYPDIDLMVGMINEGAPTCGGCERSRKLAQVCNEPALENGLPTAIDIGLPFDDIDLCFPNRLACYRGNTLWCTGDGVRAERRRQTGKREVNGKTLPIWGGLETWVDPDDPNGRVCGQGCEEFDANPVRCKPNGRLRFILRQIQTVGGCYEFRTTSWNSVANLVESLQFIQTVTGGRLRWLPLRFELVSQIVQPKHGGPANTAYVARVTYPDTPERLLEEAHRQAQIAAPLLQDLRQLEDVCRGEALIPDDEILDFRAEFDPENLEAESESDPPSDPVVVPDTSQLPPDEAPTIDAPEPPAPPVPESPEVEQPAAPGDPNRSLTEQEKLDLWRACETRAAQFASEAKIQPGFILRRVLDAHKLKDTNAMKLGQFAKFVVAINNWKPERAKAKK